MSINQTLIAACLVLAVLGSSPASASNPHEISPQSQGTDCLSCHVDTPKIAGSQPLNSKNHQAESSAYKADGIAMCTGCHDEEGGHAVGMRLDFEVPADLPLGDKNKMTCATCHYTHGSLTSDRPQASISFIDTLLDSERAHKSYLLRRNNAQGELCLTCHEVKEGTN